jgi:hypothetical protein
MGANRGSFDPCSIFGIQQSTPAVGVWALALVLRSMPPKSVRNKILGVIGWSHCIPNPSIRFYALASYQSVEEIIVATF